MMKKIEKGKPQIFITSTQIKKRIKELAAEINSDYHDRIPIFIGVLNGAFIFLSDLIREISINCEIDFLKLSSYGDQKITSGHVRLIKELNCDVKNRDVVIVEDIVDTGISIKFINSLIKRGRPKSIKIATLLYKKGISKLDFNIDYVGFEIDNKFVVGYGLDFAQKYRNLKAVYVL